MNHEAFQIRLRAMSREIAEARIKVATSASYNPVTASPQAAKDHAALMESVARWRLQLVNFTHALKSREGLLNVQSSRRLDYPARQSLRDRRANITGLNARVLELLQQIDALLDDLSREDAAFSALGNALKKILDAAQAGDGTVIDHAAAMGDFEAVVHQQPPSSSGAPGSMVTPFTSFAIAALALYAFLRKRS